MGISYFNKGVARGKLTRSEIREFKDGSGCLLSVEITTADGNRGKVTIFNTKNDPNRVKRLHEQYPLGTEVETQGMVINNEFATQDGRIIVSRELRAFDLGLKAPDKRDIISFILQGKVTRIREIDNGALITLYYEDDYNKDGMEFELEADEATWDEAEQLGVEVGCAARFKGRILNRVMYDDYGDIIGNEQKFKIENVSNIIAPEDIEEDDEQIEELDWL